MSTEELRVMGLAYCTGVFLLTAAICLAADYYRAKRAERELIKRRLEALSSRRRR